MFVQTAKRLFTKGKISTYGVSPLPQALSRRLIQRGLWPNRSQIALSGSHHCENAALPFSNAIPLASVAS
jgi:hypothetical protein